MAALAWTSLLLILKVLGVDSETRGDALPVYLRGIGWTKVEDLLQEDLRIGNAIIPTHYFLDLTVDVRGYNNANKSTFSGRVSIDVNITKAVRGIEIHAVGLDIKEAAISLPGKFNFLRTSEIIINVLRETITLFPDVGFAPSKARLEITYNGTAFRNRYGLFETWARMDGESPRIALTTFTSPTGARFWFPCYDEPDKKATFQLTVNHPSTLNAYSNTRNISSRVVFRDRIRTVFATTPILPTYMLAMSLNDLPFESITYRNHTVRAFGPGSDLAVNQSQKALEKLWNDSRFSKLTFLSEKTDIFIFEDIEMALEYPGMMVLAVGIVDRSEAVIEHEFVHMYFGNLVTQSTFDDAWIMEGFATLISDFDTIPKSENPGFASIHESPVYKSRPFTNTISSNYYFVDSTINYLKSAEIFDILSRMNPYFWSDTQNLLLNHEFGNIDVVSVANGLTLGNNPGYIQNVFSRMIRQPGTGLIVVKSINETVHIERMRFHSSYFEKYLLDTRPMMLPLTYSIDGGKRTTIILDTKGNHFSFNTPKNASITVHNDLWAVLEVIYEVPIYDLEYARRSIFAAVEIGYFTFDALLDNIRLQLHVFDEDSFDGLSSELREIFFPDIVGRAGYVSRNCSERNMTKALLEYENRSLAESRRKFTLVESDLIENLFCGFSNASDYEKFLHQTFVDNEQIIRGRDLYYLMSIAELGKFPGVFYDFFFDVFAENPNPFMYHELYRIFDAMFVDLPITDRQAAQLRHFVRSHTHLAASLSEKIAVALEKHYVVKNRTQFYNVTLEQFDAAFEKLRI